MPHRSNKHLCASLAPWLRLSLAPKPHYTTDDDHWRPCFTKIHRHTQGTCGTSNQPPELLRSWQRSLHKFKRNLKTFLVLLILKFLHFWSVLLLYTCFMLWFNFFTSYFIVFLIYCFFLFLNSNLFVVFLFKPFLCSTFNCTCCMKCAK